MNTPATDLDVRPVADRAEPVRRAVWWLVVTAVVVVPLVVAPGVDSFRPPKEATLTFFTIMIAALFAIGALWQRLPFNPVHLEKRVTVIAASIVLWTALTSAASTNRALSLQSFLWVVTVVIFWVAAVMAARPRSVAVAMWPFIAVVINAIALLLQITTTWRPFRYPDWVERHPKLTHTALIGNPNDVGAYFVAPALAALVLTLVTRGRTRIVSVLAMTVAVAGVIASQSMTAIAALTAGVIVIAALKSWRVVAATVIIIAIVMAGVVAFWTPMRMRAERLTTAANVDQLLSGRLTAFLVAVELAKERPLIGVGPGCFGWWYFDKKLEIEKKYPRYVSGNSDMFQEVHNDHLQVLSTTGVPGYFVFAGALVLLGSQSVRRDRPAGSEGTRELRFSRMLSLPLAVGFGVQALAGFPLELAAPLMTYLYFGALCVAWNGR